MHGYPTYFARVTFKDGFYQQGGSNYSIIVDEENGHIIVRAKNDRYLINGRHMHKTIEGLRANIDKIEVDCLVGKRLKPYFDILFVGDRKTIDVSPNREPIGTAAASTMSE